MKLQHDEKIVKVYHHHYFFYIWRALKFIAMSLPFFLIAYVFTYSFGNSVKITVNLVIGALFLALYAYDLTMYYLDTLIVTNQRVVHLDWVNPLKYVETQAMLNDIQNIECSENGFLSRWNFLDFGLFLVETASTRTVISFPEAPDPEGIKFFLTNMSRKHMRLEINKKEHAEAPLVTPSSDLYNLERKTESEASKVATTN